MASNNNKQIMIGADHAGYELKTHLKAYLEAEGFTVTDVGCHSSDSVDYPQIGYKLALSMQKQDIDRGVLVCGSGIGVSIAANRFPHIRAAVARSLTDALLSRQHNDANVICFGGRITAPALAIDILKTWLQTPFEGGRHAKRTQMLEEYDSFKTQEAPRSC